MLSHIRSKRQKWRQLHSSSLQSAQLHRSVQLLGNYRNPGSSPGLCKFAEGGHEKFEAPPWPTRAPREIFAPSKLRFEKMDEQTRAIDAAARAYVEASTTLADLLLVKLLAEAPDIAEKAEQALGHGEKMLLVLEFDPSAPRILWQVLNGYEKPRTLITLPARMPRSH